MMADPMEKDLRDELKFCLLLACPRFIAYRMKHRRRGGALLTETLEYLSKEDPEIAQLCKRRVHDLHLVCMKGDAAVDDSTAASVEKLIGAADRAAEAASDRESLAIVEVVSSLKRRMDAAEAPSPARLRLMRVETADMEIEK
jgi:hypothetical protein